MSMIWLSGCVTGGAFSADDVASTPTTVVIVRHAEKADDGTDDPGLSAAGRARARALADILDNTPVSAIYSTHLRRTIATAEPTAARSGVAISIRPVAVGGAAAHVDALVQHIATHHRGETVLVVGHSNTVPLIVTALSGHQAAPMAEHEYDHLYRVTIATPGQGRVRHMRYAPDRSE